MRNILQIVTAVAIIAAASSPAFARGGGWMNSRPLAKKAAAAGAEACKLHTNKCIGFGDHYYGQ
jgi:hypothetical protein